MGAAFVAAQGKSLKLKAPKARVYVKGSKGCFPWKTLKLRASEITRNEFISTNSEIYTTTWEISLIWLAKSSVISAEVEIPTCENYKTFACSSINK